MKERKMQKANYVGCFLGAALGDAIGTCHRKDRLAPGFTLPLSYGGLTQLAICTAKGLFEAAEVEKRGPAIGEMAMLGNGLIPSYTIASLKMTDSKSDHSKCAPLDDYEGMLRVFPAGLLYPDNLPTAFKIGMMACALTYESSDAMLSSGFYASVISALAGGASIQESIEWALGELAKHKGFESVNGAVITALYYVDDFQQEEDDAGREASLSHFVEKMSHSLKVLDVLTYSLVCVLLSPDDFRQGVLKSIRYSSAPHATAMMTGSLLGLMLGEDFLPDDWVLHLTNKEIVMAEGENLFNAVSV